MREILFRGKHIHLFPQNEHLNGIWVYGYLCDRNYINSPGLNGELLVDPSTVGQYTGLVDKNGNRIFEGDIIKQKDITHQGEIQIEGEKYLVTSSSGCWFGICKKPDYKSAIFLSELCNTGEVIGNIHDNPELLEEA